MSGVSKSKLCLHFNIAPHYRKSIFSLIENQFSCDWYFGQNDTNIKSLDLSLFEHVNILPNKKLIGNLSYRRGSSALIGRKEYSTFLITAESYNLSMWIQLIKAKLFYPKKRVYLWTHGLYGCETFFVKILKKIYLHLASGVFLYGYYAKDVMIKEGFDANRLFVIHNSLQYDEQLLLRQKLVSGFIYTNHFNNSSKNLIFIGRLTTIKRLDLLLHSIANLSKKGYFYNLTFVGDGPEKENLEKLSKELKIDAQVWFYGACYDEEKNAELIYNADLCVSPGNVGLTSIHCMTFGTPVITHDNFSLQMPEFEAIKPGVTGDFFKYSDISSITTCIQKWIEHHPDRDEVRNSCYEEIQKSWTPEYQLSILKKYLKFS